MIIILNNGVKMFNEVINEVNVNEVNVNEVNVNEVNVKVKRKLYGILLSRFTEDTYQESQRYRITNDIPCVYGTTRAISDYLPDRLYFVIEMNNTTNKIMGIGLIQKTISPRIKVYSNPYFNRYIYKGKYFIPIEKIKIEIIEELEKMLFYGRGHLKRGGLTLFPPTQIKPHYIEEFISVLSSYTQTYL